MLHILFLPSVRDWL